MRGISREINNKKRFCSHIKKDGIQCKRKLSKKSKFDKCWQHRLSYNISIIPRIINLRINIPTKLIGLVIIILFIIYVSIANFPSIKALWESSRPPQKIIFITEKFYQEGKETILNFTLINNDKKRIRVINDIQVDVLSYTEYKYVCMESFPREELKITNFVAKLKENEKSSEMYGTAHERVISLLKEDKAYKLVPNEIFSLSAKFELNMEHPTAEANVIFIIKVFYQEPSLKKSIICSDDVYFIKSILNLGAKQNEKKFDIEINRWNQKKFIEDNLNILKGELEAVPFDFEIFIMALVKLNREKSVPVLINSLEKCDEFNPVFYLIIYALENSKDKRAIKPLINIVESEDIKDEFSKLPAINALAEIGDKLAVPSLQKLFNETGSFYIKIITAQALNQLGENYNLTGMIIDALNNDEPYALFFIIRHEYFDEKIVDILIKKFHKEEDVFTKYSYKNTLDKFLFSDSISDFSKNLIKMAISDYKSPFEWEKIR